MSDIEKIRELCKRADGGLGATTMLVSVMPMVLDELTAARAALKACAEALEEIRDHGRNPFYPPRELAGKALTAHADEINKCIDTNLVKT